MQLMYTAQAAVLVEALVQWCPHCCTVSCRLASGIVDCGLTLEKGYIVGYCCCSARRQLTAAAAAATAITAAGTRKSVSITCH
jgi:hypothetical protein